jgi:hypothetical protein
VRAPALQVLPGLAAELGERGAPGVRADVLRDLADLLVRDVEPVVAAEADEEIVARDLGDRLRLEAEQLPDPVVLVDHEVTRAQVGEALQRAAGRRGARAGALAEDLRVGQQHEPEVAPDEAAPRGRDGEESSGSSGSGRPARGSALDAPQQVAVRSASPRCGKATTTRFPRDEAGELVLGLREPAGRDRRPLRLERERLPRGNGSSSALPSSGRSVAAPRPDLAHLLGLPDEVRRPLERRHEVVGDRRGSSSSGRVGSCRSSRRSAAGRRPRPRPRAARAA